MDWQSVSAVVVTVLLAAWIRGEQAKHKKPPTAGDSKAPPEQPPPDTAPRA